MKKTTTCAFCGQELKKGTLGIGGNKRELYLGITTLDCCPHCYEKYEDFVRRDKYRFSAKMQNAFFVPGKYTKVEKLLSREEIVSYFLGYYEEAKSYAWEHEFEPFFPIPDFDSGLSFLLSPKETAFCMPIDTIDLEVQLELNQENHLMRQMLCEESNANLCWAFDESDISCLEYAYTEQKVDEDFRMIHLEVKLNDPRQITFRPCIISGAIIYPKSLKHQDAYIDRQIAIFMLRLRTFLNVESMPIIKRESYELHGAGIAPAVKNPPKPSFMDKPVVKNVTNFLEGLADKFRTLRMVCCFLAALSTIGFLMILSSTAPTDIGYSLGGIFMLVGCVAALFACPGRFLEIIVSLAVGGFSIGLFFALIGSILGGGIGIALGIALLVYAPAFVTIPYYFKELR